MADGESMCVFFMPKVPTSNIETNEEEKGD